jgi:peptidyl-tRNA hydrolase, PTH1 family
VGADTVAVLAERAGERLRADKRSRALVATVRRPGSLVVLAVPQTYMNDSGISVGALVRRHGVSDPRHVVVVHDELDLPNGRVKLKAGGGTAGHNGLKSIHAHLHSPDYTRVRIGIGKPPGRRQGADHVLRRPGRVERDALEVALEVAADAVDAIVADGVDAAMNRYNTEPG